MADHHNRGQHSGPVNWNSLPAELRQMIWSYLSDYPVGQYTRDPGFAVSAQASTNSETQGSPPHALSLVSSTFAADGRQIWPLLGYTHLTVASSANHLPPSAFNGIQHVRITLLQTVHILRFTIPHLPPDFVGPMPASAHITLPDAPAVRHLHIYHYFRATGHLRDPTIQTALWRLQAFRRDFDVTLYFVTDNNPPRPYETFATLVLTGRHRNLSYNRRGGWNDLFFWHAIQTYRWHRYYLRRVNAPQRQAIIGAHPHYSAAPLGWQEGRQTFYPNGRPHPPPRLPPRRILSRPWDVPPQPDTTDFSALEDLESFFTTATTQTDHDSYLESLEGLFVREARGEEADYYDVLEDLEDFFNL